MCNLAQRAARERVHHDAEDVVAGFRASRGVGAEDGAGEIGAGGLDADGVEGTGMDADEEVVGAGGYGGGEGKTGWVLAAGGVGPGFHALGRGCHGGGWGRVRVLIEGGGTGWQRR